MGSVESSEMADTVSDFLEAYIHNLQIPSKEK